MEQVVYGFLKFTFFDCPERPDCLHFGYLGRCLFVVLIEMLIFGAIIFHYYQYLLYIQNIVSIVGFVIILSLALLMMHDAFDILRCKFLYELRSYYVFEISVNKNHSQSNYNRYRLLVENLAMTKFKKLSNDNCSVCRDPMETNHRKYVIQCGHTFHTHCLDQYEKSKNIDDYSPFNKCPLCRCSYHYRLEKFVFNEKYFEQLPIIYQPLSEYQLRISSFFDKLIWIYVIPNDEQKTIFEFLSDFKEYYNER